MSNQRNLFVFIFSVILSAQAFADQATEKKVKILSIPGANNTYYTALENTYSSNISMREKRRVGVGLTTGGAIGLMGLSMDFNFESTESTFIGFGRGEGYDSFQIGWRHIFEGDYLSHYSSLSYSRWYNSMTGSREHMKSSILNRVLTEKEKQDGRFGTDFVNMGIGVQYNQLSGEFSGLVFFGELTAMVEVKRSQVLPNGSIGATFYF